MNSLRPMHSQVGVGEHFAFFRLAKQRAPLLKSLHSLVKNQVPRCTSNLPVANGLHCNSSNGDRLTSQGQKVTYCSLKATESVCRLFSKGDRIRREHISFPFAFSLTVDNSSTKRWKGRAGHSGSKKCTGSSFKGLQLRLKRKGAVATGRSLLRAKRHVVTI